MNKTDLIESLSLQAGLSKAEAQRVVDTLFDAPNGIIPRALQRYDKVQITGFGTFETKRRKARSGRNPQTGEAIRIGSSKTASFRAGKGLKDSL